MCSHSLLDDVVESFNYRHVFVTVTGSYVEDYIYMEIGDVAVHGFQLVAGYAPTTMMALKCLMMWLVVIESSLPAEPNSMCFEIVIKN